MKIWTCGSSPRSGSRNAWTRNVNVNGVSRLRKFWNFFSAIQMISFRARLVTMDKTCLYHSGPETKQQSMEWRHSGSPHHKIFRVQKTAGNVLASIFGGSRRHPPHWLSPKKANNQREVLFITAGAIEGHFEGKNAECLQRPSCSCTTMPRLTGH